MEKVSKLILKWKLRICQWVGIDPAEIVVPLTKTEIDKLLAESEPWERACFLGEISNKYPPKNWIQFIKRTNCMLPHIAWWPQYLEPLHYILTQINQERNIIK